MILIIIIADENSIENHEHAINNFRAQIVISNE